MKEWLGGDKDVRVILRFLGTTPSSSDFEALLRNLCAQIVNCSVKDKDKVQHCEWPSIDIDTNVIPLLV